MKKGTAVEGATEPDRIWSEYVSTRQPELRQDLVKRYLDLTHRIAANLFAKRVNNTVGFEDYLQYGRVGLLEAIDRFDPSREASFETFAGYRIRGAILNGLEKSTESAAQAAHRRHSRLRERTQSLQLRDIGDSTARGESSPEGPTGDMELEPFAGMVDVAIMLAMGYVLEDSGEWNPAGADRAGDPYKSVQLARVRARLSLLVDALPQRERLIVRYHYFEHMEFQAIGEVLELSKGRVSQLHARALRLIRDSYDTLEEFDLEL
jgi:RNA polymerase sigma factor for flagellar operon FliA